MPEEELELIPNPKKRIDADYIEWAIAEDTESLERWMEFRVGSGDAEYVERTNDLVSIQTLARAIDDYLRFRTDGEDVTAMTFEELLHSLEPDVLAASQTFANAKRDKRLVEEVVIGFCVERAFTWSQTKQVLALLLAVAKRMESELQVMVGVPDDHYVGYI
jgi:hypothetical protein